MAVGIPPRVCGSRKRVNLPRRKTRPKPFSVRERFAGEVIYVRVRWKYIVVPVLVALILPALVIAALMSPSVELSDAAANPGGRCCVTLSGSNLAGVQRMELTIFYDSSVFFVQNFGNYTQGVEWNSDVSGELRVKCEHADEETELRNIGYFCLETRPDAACGDYSVRLTARDAFRELEDGRGGVKSRKCSVSAIGGRIRLQETPVITNSVSFMSSVTEPSAEHGEWVTMTIGSSDAFTAAGFDVAFDAELLSFASVELCADADADNPCFVTADESSAEAGIVRVSYAAANPNGGGNLFSLHFIPKASADTYTEVTVTPTGILSDGTVSPQASPVSTGMILREEAPARPLIMKEPAENGADSPEPYVVEEGLTISVIRNEEMLSPADGGAEEKTQDGDPSVFLSESGEKPAGDEELTAQDQTPDAAAVSDDGNAPRTLTILAQPADQTVHTGETAEFEVQAVSDGTIQYRWEYRRDPAGSWKKCLAAGKASYSPKGRGFRDGTQYRCVVKDVFGNESVSKPAVLRVEKRARESMDELDLPDVGRFVELPIAAIPEAQLVLRENRRDRPNAPGKRGFPKRRIRYRVSA